MLAGSLLFILLSMIQKKKQIYCAFFTVRTKVENIIFHAHIIMLLVFFSIPLIQYYFILCYIYFLCMILWRNILLCDYVLLCCFCMWLMYANPLHLIHLFCASLFEWNESFFWIDQTLSIYCTFPRLMSFKIDFWLLWLAVRWL